jgi:hypothetical protein
MKCANHHAEANAVCAYCGRALCAECGRASPGQRTACSATCAAALTKADAAVELILQKSAQSARASALNCYLGGGIFVATGVLAAFIAPMPFLIIFPPALGIVLIISGIAYSRAAKRQTPEPSA